MNTRVLSGFLFAALVFSPFLAHADYLFYGQAHLSSDAVRVSGENQFAVGSNASRLGIKGSEELSPRIQAVWKLESQLDFTGESGSISARNRYLGVVTPFGTVVGGYQDTPFRALGAKVDVMPETIADRRSILGSVRDQYDPITVDIYNLRAKRSLMYVSPRIAGLQVRAMLAYRQFGHYEINLGAKHSEALASYSAVYKTRFLYLGVAYQQMEMYEQTDVTRFAGGVTLDKTDINVAYEMMYSGKDSVFYRNSYGVSLRHWVYDTAILAQVFYAEKDYYNRDSEGLLYAVGVSQKMSKNVDLYLIAARVENQAVASFRLGAAEHGEVFAPAARGGDLTGVSFGMTYTF